jgi:hypothetical protein
VGVISYTGLTGSSSKGGIKRIFSGAIEADLVDTTILSALSGGIDGPSDEQEEAQLDLVGDSCIIIIGATDFGQQSGDDGQEAPVDNTDLWFIPEVTYDEGTETYDASPVAKAIRDRVNEGAMLIISSSFCDYPDGGEPDGIDGEYISHDQITSAQTFLDYLRTSSKYAPSTLYDPIEYLESSPDGTPCSGVDCGYQFTGYIQTQLWEVLYDLSCDECDYLGSECMGLPLCLEPGNNAGCDLCGPCGTFGHLKFPWGYDRFEFDANKTELFGDLSKEETIYLQRYRGGATSGGMPLTSESPAEMVIEKIGIGYVVAWTSCQALMGYVGYVNFNYSPFSCAFLPGQCYEPLPYTDGYECSNEGPGGDRYAYEENEKIMTKIVRTLVGTRVDYDSFPIGD